MIEEDYSEKMDNLFNEYPRDLLQRFDTGSSMSKEEQNDEEKEAAASEEIELNLGLSLGGKFGIDKNPNKLIRSASVASSIPMIRINGGDITNPPPVMFSALIRTSSLPTETEDEWRKRKELQGLKRLEAKKRRLEKQKSPLKRGSSEGSSSEEEKRKIDKAIGMSMKLLVDESTATTAEGKGDFFGAGGGLQQGSIEGSSSGGEVRSSGNNQSNREAKQNAGTSVEAVENPSSKKADLTEKMEDMPCVFTKGEGPNGRRIDGILYRYGGKGEQVRIMCVCHGSFLSPAEFVKHAGGGDVAHPLRHIVINPSINSFF